jgi:hypothetical protein
MLSKKVFRIYASKLNVLLQWCLATSRVFWEVCVEMCSSLPPVSKLKSNYVETNLESESCDK